MEIHSARDTASPRPALFMPCLKLTPIFTRSVSEAPRPHEHEALAHRRRGSGCFRYSIKEGSPPGLARVCHESEWVVGRDFETESQRSIDSGDSFDEPKGKV